MSNHHTPHNSNNKDKKLVLQFIRKEVEKGTGLSLKELKEKYSEEQLFFIGFKYVTTTKKACCTALNIPIEAGCRYKRKYENEGALMQSIDDYVCPCTLNHARFLSTNPEEFERLCKSNTNQLKLL